MVAPTLQESVIELPISPGRQARQEKDLLLETTLQQGLEVRPVPIPQREPARGQDINSEWLRWIGEQVVGAVSKIEAEETAQWDRLFATTEKLERAQSRI